ncbi:glycosyltransferase [Mastigocoleus testarum]|uniref:Glycosyltransferase family 28 N-terminal domain-containing protein n=1 Tax=Mastigocoleus testarum BC008 TaxID=371196 RepID=A0A0V7ZVH7_9CYAN|nr:glycosyltransferase [Mastigocoleus testarum]KST68478.1 hypothetical protein BC008_00995 [Mastigocoleus testarum BC008]
MKIVLVVLGGPGHIFPMLSLANQLKMSEHEIVICSHLDGKEKIEAAGFNFYPLAEILAPKGYFNSMMMNNNTGIKAMFNGLNTMDKLRGSEIEDLTEFISKGKPDILIIDFLQTSGIAVAEKYEIPYFIISLSLPEGFDANIPPIATSWQYEQTNFSKVKNRIANYIFNKIFELASTTINEYTKKNKLSKFKGITPGVRNSLAYITQVPSQFDLTQKLPENVYYTGPFVNSLVRKNIFEFPWEKLNGKPIVYASLGTIANNKPKIFKTIASAFEGIEAQLIMSVGDLISQQEIDAIPGKPLIVRFAPQLEILDKAKLFITHVGMNSTLESLRAGVPILALPQTSDQPGIAARVKHIGVGEFILSKDITVESIRSTAKTILSNPEYKQKAVEFSQLTSMQNGCQLAADIIESKILLET